MPSYREITVAGEGRPRRAGKASRAAVPRDWRAALRGALTGAVTLCRRSPGTALGALVAVAAAGFVCVNALGYQSGRHPAPILPKVAAKEMTAKGATPREVAAKEAPPGPVRVIPQADPAPKQAARDAIGDLIRSEDTTASVTPKQPAKPPVREAVKSAAKPDAKPDAAPEAPVLRAQRALAKLGYGIKPDGALGPGTRAALERFERERKLPVTGEASGRTLRELMARAGQG